jgi:hypothetical protein
MTVMSYFEMPSEDEIPPEEMWGHDEQLTAWFEDVKRARANPQQMETIPDMTENELAAELGL